MRLSISLRHWRTVCSLTALIIFAAIAAPTFATAGTITFSVPTIDVPYSATQDQTGYFDVTVYESGGSDKLYQFQVDLLLDKGSSNVQFISADFFNTVAPYVLAPGNSEDFTQGDVPFWNAVEAASADSVSSNAGATALSTTLLAMLRVEYEVPAGTAIGSYALTFNQNDPNSDPFSDYVNTVSNTDNSQIPPAVVNGAIVVTPEPSSAVLVLLGAAGVLGYRRLRNRRV